MSATEIVPDLHDRAISSSLPIPSYSLAALPALGAKGSMPYLTKTSQGEDVRT